MIATVELFLVKLSPTNCFAFKSTSPAPLLSLSAVRLSATVILPFIAEPLTLPAEVTLFNKMSPFEAVRATSPADKSVASISVLALTTTFPPATPVTLALASELVIFKLPAKLESTKVTPFEVNAALPPAKFTLAFESATSANLSAVKCP